MATAVKVGNGTIELSGMAADWSLASSTDKTGHLNRLGAGIKITYVRFLPNAASDQLVLKDTSDSGATIVNLQAASTNDFQVAEVMAWKKPYLDYSACRFTTGAVVYIDFE